MLKLKIIENEFQVFCGAKMLKTACSSFVASNPAIHQDVRVVGTAVHKGEERGYVPMHSDTCQEITCAREFRHQRIR